MSYIPPTTLGEVAASTRFSVEASGALATGGLVALLRAAAPGSCLLRGADAARRWLFDEAPPGLDPGAALGAVVLGLAGIPFFLFVGGVEASILVWRTR